ncbi:MAG: hypothetical protein HYV34_04720 [Candidatus Kerfeldbacteria bacterium]|nr:hypothetical protein [Candidatus Kerfeldbacteria bacterium]
MISRRALKAISTMPIEVGPFRQSTTGAIVPFFNDSRRVYGHPEVFAVFVEELAKRIRAHRRRGHRIDGIVGIPMAGIPLGAAIAQRLKLPFGYLNTKRKKTLTKKLLEGEFRSDARVALVDDVIGLGGTIQHAICDCKREGVAVTFVVTMWNPWPRQNANFLKRLRRRGIFYDTLYTRFDWISYLASHGIASQDMVDIQKAFLANVTGWQTDPKMWKKFLTWKRRWRATGKM